MQNGLPIKLKALRKACGYTQKSVAQTLGLDRTTYSCYERGVTQPDANACLIISKLYGISMEELMGQDPPQVYNDGVEDYSKRSNYPDISIPDHVNELSRTERSLICLFRSISAQQQIDILENLYDMQPKPKKD